MPASQRRQITASERRLLTVLFTDIVGSTDLAVEMGDARWRELIARHHRIVRDALRRFGGREIDTAGDGFFATFDKPTQAIRCAAAVVEEVRDLGIEIQRGYAPRRGRGFGEERRRGRGPYGRAGARGGRSGGSARHGHAPGVGGRVGLDFADRGTARAEGCAGHVASVRPRTAVDGRALSSVVDPSLRLREHRAAIAAPTLLRWTRPTSRDRRRNRARRRGRDRRRPRHPIVSDRSWPCRIRPPLGSVLKVDAADGSIEHTARDVVVAHGGGNPKITVGEGGVWVEIQLAGPLNPETGWKKRGATDRDDRRPAGRSWGRGGLSSVWIGGAG